MRVSDETFERLLVDHHTHIVAAVGRFEPRRERREDQLGACLGALWENRHAFDPLRAGFVTWMGLIVRRICWRAYAAETRGKRGGRGPKAQPTPDARLTALPDPRPGVEATVVAQHLAARLAAALPTLEPAHQDVLALVEDGADFTAAAQERGVCRQALYSRLATARRRAIRAAGLEDASDAGSRDG